MGLAGDFRYRTETLNKYDVDEKDLMIMILSTLQNIENQLTYTTGTVTMDDLLEGVRRCEIKF